MKHSTATHRFSSVESRLAAIVGTTTTLIPHSTTAAETESNAAAGQNNHTAPVSVDHPLAMEEDNPQETTNKKSVPELPKLVPATSSNTAIHCLLRIMFIEHLSQGNLSHPEVCDRSDDILQALHLNLQQGPLSFT